MELGHSKGCVSLDACVVGEEWVALLQYNFHDNNRWIKIPEVAGKS